MGQLCGEVTQSFIIACTKYVDTSSSLVFVPYLASSVPRFSPSLDEEPMRSGLCLMGVDVTRGTRVPTLTVGGESLLV